MARGVKVVVVLCLMFPYFRGSLVKWQRMGTWKYFFKCNFCSGNMLWMHIVCFKFWEHFLITLEIWVLGCLSAPRWEGEFVLINTDWIKDRLYWFSFRWVLKVFYDFQKLNRDCSVIFFFLSLPQNRPWWMSLTRAYRDWFLLATATFRLFKVRWKNNEK